MGEYGESLQQSDIVENNQSNNPVETTIEDALKQKLPNNKEKQDFFNNIFKQAAIQESFSQQNIVQYIKKNPLSSQFRTLKNQSPEEQTRIIFEDMDLQTKTIDGSLKSIQTYKNEVISDTTKNISDTTEIAKLNEEYKQFLKTKKSFTELPVDKQIQVSEENKKDIPEKIIKTAKEKIKTIKENDPKAEIEINDYLSFYLTAQQNDIKNTEFEKDFEKLNIMWGIGKISLSEMSNPNNADKIASELNYSDNSPTLNKLSTPNLPETKDFDEEFDMYIKFIDDEKERQEFTEKKDDLKKYKEIYDKTPEEAIKIQEGTLNEIYDRYESAIKSIKEELPTQTKEFAKQRLFFSSRIQFQKMLRGSIFSFNS